MKTVKDIMLPLVAAALAGTPVSWAWAACVPLNLTSPQTLARGEPNEAYHEKLQSSGGQSPVSFQRIDGSLPPGLDLNASGVISGFPATPGTFGFTIEATDSCQPTANKVVKAYVINVGCAMRFTGSDTLPDGTIGEPYSYQISTTGGLPPITVDFIDATFPRPAPYPGITMKRGGLITGTPKTAGRYQFVVRATDRCSPALGGKQRIERTYSLDVKAKGSASLLTNPPALPRVVYCANRRATIVGTPGPDTMQGTPGDDVINGLGGDDVIYGGGGDDIICGGTGNDTLHGDTGNRDWLYGEGGNDKLYGGAGAFDYCSGGPGQDVPGGGCEVLDQIP